MTVVYGDGKVMEYIKDITTSAAHFMGEYNPNILYDYGAITMRNGEAWAFTGTSWECLGIAETGIAKEYITNCPNCGAPMHNHKCLYCGTEDYGKN